MTNKSGLGIGEGMRAKNETWFNNCPGVKLSGSIGFSIVLVQVCVCTRVFTESMTIGVCGFSSLQ